MFDKLKAIFKIKKEEKEGVVHEETVHHTRLATKGLKVGSLVAIDYPMLAIEDDLAIKVVDKANKVTGISRNEERGNYINRYYLENDTFIQLEFFGEDKAEAVSSVMIFDYDPELCEDLTDTNEDRLSYWRQVIEEDSEFKIGERVYNRVSPHVLGGLEVVELINDELNTLENNFAVFERNVTKTMIETVIVNVEQEVTLNDDGEVIEQGDISVSVAIGVGIPHDSLDVSRM